MLLSTICRPQTALKLAIISNCVCLQTKYFSARRFDIVCQLQTWSASLPVPSWKGPHLMTRTLWRVTALILFLLLDHRFTGYPHAAVILSSDSRYEMITERNRRTWLRYHACAHAFTEVHLFQPCQGQRCVPRAGGQYEAVTRVKPTGLWGGQMCLATIWID